MPTLDQFRRGPKVAKRLRECQEALPIDSRNCRKRLSISCGGYSTNSQKFSPRSRRILSRVIYFHPHRSANEMSLNADEATTKPTLQTVLDRINVLGSNLQTQITSLQEDVNQIKTDVALLKTDVALLKNDNGLIRFELTSLRDEFRTFRNDIEIRLDRLEGVINLTRADLVNLRADFREFKSQFKSSTGLQN